MIFELRTYTSAPFAQNEYQKLNAEISRPIRGDRYGKFEGGWTTPFEAPARYIHLWSFDSLEERARLRDELYRNNAWVEEYVPRIRPLLLKQENKIMVVSASFTKPSGAGNIYEICTYRLRVGKLVEWLAAIHAIAPVRDKYSRHVWLWRTEIGPLNEAVELRAYTGVEQRTAAQERALKNSDWQAFLAETSHMLLTMEATILLPTAVAPLR